MLSHIKDWIFGTETPVQKELPQTRIEELQLPPFIVHIDNTLQHNQQEYVQNVNIHERIQWKQKRHLSIKS